MPRYLQQCPGLCWNLLRAMAATHSVESVPCNLLFFSLMLLRAVTQCKSRPLSSLLPWMIPVATLQLVNNDERRFYEKQEWPWKREKDNGGHLSLVRVWNPNPKVAKGSSRQRGWPGGWNSQSRELCMWRPAPIPTSCLQPWTPYRYILKHL